MEFSIITPVYNNTANLEDAIRSVTSQTYTDIEYIIIDGGSTDGSVDILRSVSGRTQGDSKFKWISEPDTGIYDALNKGIKMAAGDVIGLLHSDDVFADEHVIEKAAALFEKENADMLYSDLEYIDSRGKTFRKWHSGEFKSLRFGWMPPHPTLFIKKKLFDTHGLYNTMYRISSDYDMVLRLFGSGKYKISYLPEITVKMRTGGASNGSVANIIQKSREDYSALKANGMPFPIFALICKNLRKLGQFR